MKTKSSSSTFDYDSKIWGDHELRVTPIDLGALRLKYALGDLVQLRGRILEVGSGGGAMARAIKVYRQELELIGCDISSRALREANFRGGGIAYTYGSAYDLPFASGEFSVVLMFDVLEHLEEPGNAISEAVRVIMPGGLLHVSVPCEGSVMTLQGLVRKTGSLVFERTVGHIQAFTVGTINSLMSGMDLQLMHWRWSGHLVSQFAHCAYVGWLSVPGVRMPSSVEGYLQSSRGGLVRLLVSHLKRLIALLSYYESIILRRVPGALAHITLRKSGEAHHPSRRPPFTDEAV